MLSPGLTTFLIRSEYKHVCEEFMWKLVFPKEEVKYEEPLRKKVKGDVPAGRGVSPRKDGTKAFHQNLTKRLSFLISFETQL